MNHKLYLNITLILLIVSCNKSNSIDPVCDLIDFRDFYYIDVCKDRNDCSVILHFTDKLNNISSKDRLTLNRTSDELFINSRSAVDNNAPEIVNCIVKKNAILNTGLRIENKDGNISVIHFTNDEILLCEQSIHRDMFVEFDNENDYFFKSRSSKVLIDSFVYKGSKRLTLTVFGEKILKSEAGTQTRNYKETIIENFGRTQYIEYLEKDTLHNFVLDSITLL